MKLYSNNGYCTGFNGNYWYVMDSFARMLNPELCPKHTSKGLFLLGFYCFFQQRCYIRYYIFMQQNYPKSHSHLHIGHKLKMK